MSSPVNLIALRKNSARAAVFLSELGEAVWHLVPDSTCWMTNPTTVSWNVPLPVADVIVTGDREMLDLGSYEGIRIMTLREFLKSG